MKGKMGASGREFEDRNRNMKEVIVIFFSLLTITQRGRIVQNLLHE